MLWYASPFLRLDPEATPGYQPVTPSAAPAPRPAVPMWNGAPSAPAPAAMPATVAPPSPTSAAPSNAQDLQNQAVALVTAARAKSNEYPQGMPADVAASVNLMIDQAITLQESARQQVEAGRRQKATEDILANARRMDPIIPGMNADARTSTPDDDSAARTVEVRSKSGRGTERVVLPTVKDAEHVNAYRAYISDAPNGQTRFTYQHDATLREKALAVGVSTQGGYLVPSLVLQELVVLLRDLVWMRSAARVLPPLAQAADVSVNSVEANLSDATWTSELGTPSQDSVEPFGRRKLHPHPLSKEILVSRTLLRQSAADVEGWINEQMAAAFAAPEESAFMVGTGAQQPEGIFTSSAVTNIVTAAAAAALTADDIIKTEFSLKAQYRARASWIMHRLVLQAVHLLKDGNGQYMLVPGLAAGARFILRGYPVMESEYAPSTIAASQDVALLGDIRSAYWIADTLNFEMQRLVEIAARTNQDSFIGRKETDGMVVNPQGLAKLRMAAA